MEDKTMLCIDSETLANPGLLGLQDENLSKQKWLSVFCDAAAARAHFNSASYGGNAWVVSSDDMEGINLAAALKHDSRAQEVSLVAFSCSGSEVSRCEAAGVSLIKGKGEFARRFGERKLHAAKQELSESLAQLKTEDPFEGSDNSLEPLLERVFDPEEEPLAPAIDRPSREEPLAQGEELADKPRFREVPARQGSMVVSIVSGSGGVGKSTIAVSMAVLFQRMGKKTVLLDADLQFGDMEFLLGKEGSIDVVELLRNPEKLAQVVPEGEMPALIAAPRKLEESESAGAHMGDLVNQLKGSFDVVVVNTGSSWSESHAQLIESSDQTLFVLDQRPSSIRACSHALDLCARCGIATQSFRFGLNFCSRHALLTSIDVSCALHGVKVDEIKDGGKEVGELLGAGLPLELLDSKNAFVESIRSLCQSLLPENDEAEQVALAAPKKRRFLGGFRKGRAACL